MRPIREQLKLAPHGILTGLFLGWMLSHAIEDIGLVAMAVWRRWGQPAACP